MKGLAILAWGGLLLLAACAETDPYQRQGVWQPSGANARNLAAMVASPNDLLRGRGSRGATGPEAGSAVTRLWAGKPTPLPNAPSQQGAQGPTATAGGNGGS